MEKPVETIDYFLKIKIVGNSLVGRSSLLKRYDHKTFSANYQPTIGIEFILKNIEINGKKLRLQIWDKSEAEEFRSVNWVFYRGVHGVIISYDCTNENSFYNLTHFIDQIRAVANNNICKVIIATKCDLIDKKVDTERAKRFAQNLGIRFFETSSKDNINVDETFEYLAREILEKYGEDVKYRPKVPPQTNTAHNSYTKCTLS
jgi:small GTP-binding protein